MYPYRRYRYSCSDVVGIIVVAAIITRTRVAHRQHHKDDSATCSCSLMQQLQLIKRGANRSPDGIAVTKCGRQSLYSYKLSHMSSSSSLCSYYARLLWCSSYSLPIPQGPNTVIPHHTWCRGHLKGLSVPPSDEGCAPHLYLSARLITMIITIMIIWIQWIMILLQSSFISMKCLRTQDSQGRFTVSWIGPCHGLMIRL